jgi:hypothetical protein
LLFWVQRLLVLGQLLVSGTLGALDVVHVSDCLHSVLFVSRQYLTLYWLTALLVDPLGKFGLTVWKTTSKALAFSNRPDDPELFEAALRSSRVIRSTRTFESVCA